MRITFVLDGAGHKPIGGFKVVYEYANHLVARGHTVTIVHPARSERQPSWYWRLRGGARYLKHRLANSYAPDAWFSLDERARLRWVPSLRERYIPDADAIVATAWRTAEWVTRYPARTGRKFYLIQHQETWSGDKSRVMATWTLPLEKIVIARWLQDLAHDIGESACHIPNGLDFDAFGCDVPPAQRDPKHLMMLYHDSPWKGSADGLAALHQAKEYHPDTTATLFGIPASPALPDWIDYERTPTQTRLRRLYNQAAIFVAPSISEGWGLPPAEAMMSGAALVATSAGGHLEFARHGSNALLSPPQQPDQLAQHIVQLIADPAQRIEFAQAGRAHIQQFTWARATTALEAVLSGSVETTSARTTPEPRSGSAGDA